MSCEIRKSNMQGIMNERRSVLVFRKAIVAKLRSNADNSSRPPLKFLIWPKMHSGRADGFTGIIFTRDTPIPLPSLNVPCRSVVPSPAIHLSGHSKPGGHCRVALLMHTRSLTPEPHSTALQRAANPPFEGAVLPGRCQVSEDENSARKRGKERKEKARQGTIRVRIGGSSDAFAPDRPQRAANHKACIVRLCPAPRCVPSFQLAAPRVQSSTNRYGLFDDG